MSAGYRPQVGDTVRLGTAMSYESLRVTAVGQDRFLAFPQAPTPESGLKEDVEFSFRPEPRSRGRFEAHYTPAGYIAHVLVDDVGLVALRDAFGVGPANPYAAAYSPMVADITGVPIYVDQCPCSVAEATSPSDGPCTEGDSASLEVEYMIGTGEYDALRSGDPLTDLKRFDLVERTPYFRRPVALDDSPEDDAAGVGS